MSDQTISEQDVLTAIEQHGPIELKPLVNKLYSPDNDTSPSEVADEYDDIEQQVRTHATTLIDRKQVYVTLDWKYDV